MTGNAFLAVPLDPDKRHELSAALSAASPGFPVPGRRVHPDNWHITLRFLGECDDLLLDRVAAALDESLDASRGVVHVDGIGAFPKPARAGVVYASIDDGGILDSLAALCEELVRDVGFAPEERAFVPHITLSRLRPRRDVTRLIERYDTFSMRLPVNSVVLYRTTRTSDGIRYAPLHTFDLA